jgi:uncharacterized protein YgiM (DUF1202 family)
VSVSRLRSQPTLTGEVLAELVDGDVVTILGQTPNAGYVLVRTEDGTEGWVAKQTVALEDLLMDIPVVTPQP